MVKTRVKHPSQTADTDAANIFAEKINDINPRSCRSHRRAYAHTRTRVGVVAMRRESGVLLIYVTLIYRSHPRWSLFHRRIERVPAIWRCDEYPRARIEIAIESHRVWSRLAKTRLALIEWRGEISFGAG